MRRLGLILLAVLSGITGVYAQAPAVAPPKPTAPKPAAPKIFAPFLSCILPGTLQITGKLSVDADPKTFKVERNYKPVELDGDPAVDHTSGLFAVRLKERLLPGNGVRLTGGTPPN